MIIEAFIGDDFQAKKSCFCPIEIFKNCARCTKKKDKSFKKWRFLAPLLIF